MGNLSMAQFAKLPKAAQNELQRLEANIESITRQRDEALAAQQLFEGSYGSFILPAGYRYRTQGEDPTNYSDKKAFNLALLEPGLLRVSTSGHALNIRPEVSNVVIIRTEQL